MNKSVLPPYAAFLLFSGHNCSTFMPSAWAMALRSRIDLISFLIVMQIAALVTPSRRAISAIEMPLFRSSIFIFVAWLNMLRKNINKMMSFVKQKV